MNILITNDDGIQASGILLLAQWARKLGTVTVCAPAAQQSGASHSISIHRNMHIAPAAPLLDGIETWQVDSSPADCVRWGTLGLNRTYDLVLSGVNRGYNLGEDIVYSGTCGAIFEAGTRGLKGIAISAEHHIEQLPMQYLDDMWAFIVNNKLLEKYSLLNVNFPPDSKGVKLTTQGGAYFTDDFVHLGDNIYQQQGYCVHNNRHDLHVDTDATVDGWTTVSPLTIRRSV